MSDLTTEHFRTCAHNLFFETKITGSSGKVYIVTYCETPSGPYQYGWFCECSDFTYRKNDNCKHIQQAKKLKCSWGWEAFMGTQLKTAEDNKCPECGGDTRVIRVGV